MRIDLKPDAVARCIDEVGFGFMFAPAHHGATRFVVPVRKELAVRTIFNFLGPLTNPAGRHAPGDRRLGPAFLETIAGALARLGAAQGAGSVQRRRSGRDEHVGRQRASSRSTAATCAPTRSRPEDVGLARAEPDGARRAARPTSTPQTTRRIFAGEPGPARDLAVLNAGAAIYVAGTRRTRSRRACAPPRRRSTTAAPPRALDALVAPDARSWRPHERARPHRRRHARRGRAPAQGACRSSELEAAIERRAGGLPPVLGGADAPRRLADRRAQAALAVGGRDPRGLRRSTEIVQAYERGGAAALSILTEPFHFGGSLDDLREARAATDAAGAAQGLHRRPLPALRGRGRGRRRDPADRRRARRRRRSRELLREARALDLDALVEVHDERELERALEVEADVLGINNRDLTDFTRRHRAHVRAARRRPGRQDRRVASPASRTREQLDELERVGVDAVLIGETLMRAPDIEAACRELTGVGELP